MRERPQFNGAQRLVDKETFEDWYTEADGCMSTNRRDTTVHQAPSPSFYDGKSYGEVAETWTPVPTPQESDEGAARDEPCGSKLYMKVSNSVNISGNAILAGFKSEIIIYGERSLDSLDSIVHSFPENAECTLDLGDTHVGGSATVADYVAVTRYADPSEEFPWHDLLDKDAMDFSASIMTMSTQELEGVPALIGVEIPQPILDLEPEPREYATRIYLSARSLPPAPWGEWDYYSLFGFTEEDRAEDERGFEERERQRIARAEARRAS